MTCALTRPTGVMPPGDPRLSRTETRLVAAPAQSLAAAAEWPGRPAARSACWAMHLRAGDVARSMAVGALSDRSTLAPGAPPLLLLSGGELTVTRRGRGIGGPNAEFALTLALALDGAAGIHALACDTDGVDGAAEVAGAMIGPDTLSRAQAVGLS